MNDILKEKDGFYPTPKELGMKMCKAIGEMDHLILEPSGGKGDLIDCIMDSISPYVRKSAQIDTCEIDPDLRNILVGKYSQERINSLVDEVRKIEEKRHVCIWDNKGTGNYHYEDQRTEAEKLHQSVLQSRIDRLREIPVRVVHDDFLRYETERRYDVIIMNPPFDEGDKHLIKALSLLKPGGKLECLLNAETLLNPYSNSRKALVNVLDKLEAEIEYMDDAFKKAERSTDVTIAHISLKKPQKTEFKSRILEGMEQAKGEYKSGEYEADAVSTKTDWKDAMVEQYQHECKIGLALYEEWLALKPYMKIQIGGENPYDRTTVNLRCGDHDFTPERYLASVRTKYWRAFFSNPEFRKSLTSNLSQAFEDILKDAEKYEFNLYNIMEILKKAGMMMGEALEETIDGLFEKLTAAHSWYPECANNIHYYNGWKTNKAHKVNDKKSILPINGFSSYSWDPNKLDQYHIIPILSDIEKCLNYLAVGSPETFFEMDVSRAIQAATEARKTKDINLTYFTVTFYKKGTCHIKWREETKPLLEKLNIMGSRKRNWLPPSYGKKTYQDMTEEEKAVIDDFQGQEAYERVIQNKDYYITESNMPLLPIAN